MASTHSENFYRVASLIVDTGTNVLRELFLRNVSSSPSKTLDQFLIDKTSVIVHLQKRRILRHDQLVLLKPLNGQAADPVQWDISLLYILLKNFCTLSQQDSSSLESLRLSRNVIYGHIGQAVLSEVDFQNHWTSIETCVKSLCRSCNDKGFENKIADHIKLLKSGSLDTGTSAHLLKNWYHQDQLLQARLDSVHQQIDDLSLKTKGLSTSRPEQPDHVFINLQSHTRVLIQEKNKLPFAECEQYVRARALLQQQDVVTICGKPGEGKTLAALKLMKEMAKVEKCLVIYSPSQLDHVDVGEVDVLLIDDMLGKHQLDRGKLGAWLSKLNTLQAFISQGKSKLIITSRSNILVQCAAEIREYALFNHRIEFSSELLSADEKQEILMGLLKWHDRDPNQVDVKKCCDQFKSPIGFPYSAFLFSSDTQLFKKKDVFFSRPLEFFRETLGALDRVKFIALLFLFYKQNVVEEGETRLSRTKPNKENVALLHHISNLVGLKQSEVTLQTVLDCLRQFQGIYVTEINNAFSFSHNTVYECVTLIHAESYPEEVIEHCSEDFLNECITTAQFSDSAILVVETDCFDVLAARIIHEVVDKSRIFHIVTHPSFQTSEFCDSLYTYACQENMLQRFLTRSGSGNEEIQSCILRIYLQNYNESEAMYLVKKGISRLDCSQGCVSKSCWRCEVKRDTVRGACLTGNMEILQLLIDSGAEILEKNLQDAAEGKDLKMVLKVCRCLKSSQSFDPEGYYTSKALVIARNEADQTLFNVLLKEGVRFTNLCLHDFVQEGNLVTVRETVECLKTAGRWNPQDVWLQMSVDQAITKKQNGIYEFLKSEGAFIGSRSLLSAVESNGVDFAKSIIDHMKASGKWRTCDKKMSLEFLRSLMFNASTGPFDIRDHVSGPLDSEMAKVLIAARKLDDKTIYSLLTVEGIKLTMNALKWGVESGDKCFVAEIIQELKECNEWNPKDTEAGEALVSAQSKGLTDIVAILQAEAVTLSMENLTSAFSKTNDTTFVIKIIETLESIGKWNPRHIAIETILVESFCQEDRTLYNFLVSKGASLSFQSLMSAIPLGDVESLRKMIKTMKSLPNWNPSHMGLCMCLELTKLSNPQIYAMMIEEGIGFSSKSYLDAALRNDSLSVMMAIENLMKSNTWLPKQDADIEKGLQILCLHRNMMMYNISVKKGAVPTKRCILYAIEGRSAKPFTTANRCKRAAVPRLDSLCIAHLSQYCFEYAAEESLYVLWKFICALGECGKWDPKEDRIMKTLETACEKCQILVYNTLVEAGVQPSMRCLYKLITSVTKSVKENRPQTLMCHLVERLIHHCIDRALKDSQHDILEGLVTCAISLGLWNPEKQSIRETLQFTKDKGIVEVLVGAGVKMPSDSETHASDEDSAEDVQPVEDSSVEILYERAKHTDSQDVCKQEELTTGHDTPSS